MPARFVIGDTRAVVAAIPDGSIDLVFTSPPFLSLRSYLPHDHPDKAAEIGGEPNPGAFIDTMLELTEEWARVLAPHGSLAVELGDTYSGSGGEGGDLIPGSGGLNNRKKQQSAGSNGITTTRRAGEGWPLRKSMCLVPESYRWALVYGRNPHTGRPTPPWIARNVVTWVRRNPPVGFLGDKFRPATSDMVIACKSDDRWFDLDAVRTVNDRTSETVAVSEKRMGRMVPGSGPESKPLGAPIANNPAGAPPLDWWDISPGGYTGSHYAVFPEELCVRPINAMCPRRVCLSCGVPSRRITGDGDYDTSRPQTARALEMAEQAGLTAEHLAAIRSFGIGDVGKAAETQRGRSSERVMVLAMEAKAVLGGYFREFVGGPESVTIGWTSCGCAGTDGLRLDGFHTGTGWRPGVVLDPFGGSGTVGVVAVGHGRDAILVDIDSRNADLAVERNGMFVTVEHHGTQVVA